MRKLTGLGAVISRWGNNLVTLVRPGVSTYDADGSVTTTAATTSQVALYVERPALAGDLKHLPEGDRTSRTCSVWSATELRHRDLLTLSDGETYEMQAVEPWTQAGFWRAVGLKVQ